MIELVLSEQLIRQRDTLRQAGLDLYAPEGFEDILENVEATGRKYQMPMMSLERNDFTSEQAFWLFLRKENVTVGGVSAKFFDLGGEGLDRYLRRTSQMQYGRSDDPIENIAPPIRDEIKRKLIYIGELEIHPSARGQRSIVTALMKSVQYLAALRWSNFDWMYAFMATQHKRLITDYGFTWQIPNAITWKEPIPDGRRNDHWFVALPRSHFMHACHFS